MDRFMPGFPNLRVLGEGWVYLKILKIIWTIIKWCLYIFGLIIFWIAVCLALIYRDYLIQLFQFPEKEEVIESAGLVLKTYVTPSAKNLIILIASTVVLNLTFNFILRFGTISYRQYHYTSAFIGYLLLQINYRWQNMILIVGFLITILLLLRRVKTLVEKDIRIVRPIYTVSLSLAGILCLGEMVYPFPNDWQMCRRVMVIMAMKTISFSMDDYYIRRTSRAEMLGYLLSPPTVLFGPWITLETYTIYYIRHMKLGWKWVVKMGELFTYAMICLVLANYLDNYYVPVLQVRSLRIAFLVPQINQNAFAYRVGNYFVGYMAEFAMITAGFNTYHHFDPQQRWRYPVTRAFTVEFPRSMDVAMQNWNIPAYSFLVQNIYAPFSEINKSSAIAMSFLVTLLMHGLNTRTMMVMVSLGLWTYAQEIIQDKLATMLSCCCRIYPCPDGCGHQYGFWNPITMIINGINLCLNMVHLVFMGHIMHRQFDGSTIWDIWRVWRGDIGLVSYLSIVIWLGVMAIVA